MHNGWMNNNLNSTNLDSCFKFEKENNNQALKMLLKIKLKEYIIKNTCPNDQIY